MKPYIDQSTGENNQKEFSIHGLSEAQLKFIQFGLKYFKRNCDKIDLDASILSFCADNVFTEAEKEKMENIAQGVAVILEHDFK